MKKIFLLTVFCFVSAVQSQNKLENDSPLLEFRDARLSADYEGSS
jgi:hypothetical protein